MYIHASGAGVPPSRLALSIDAASLASYFRAALLLALAVTINIATPVALHAQATDGVITGTASDPQGAALANVTVTARNTETGTSRTVQSGPNGDYRLTALRAGTYDLSFSLAGFATSKVSDIVLTVGLEFQRNITLTAGGVEETVNVSAQQPLVDTTSSEGGTAVISQTQIDSLPISGRQATQLSLLLPGTGTDSTRQQRPDANVGAGDANVADTNYLVDGLTNMISGAGDPRDNIQEASIREFKVILTQTPAEYGGRSGGVVSLVTKSGTNKIHGEAFEFFRDHYINRVDYYTQNLHDADPGVYPIPPFNRNQFGGAIGGPILKDRLHYFASFERLDDQEYFTVAPGGTGATAAQQAVQKDYASLAGSFRSGSEQNSYFGRLDWQINPSHTAFVRFFEQNPNLYYCNGCNGSTAAYSTADGGVQGWTWAAGETWVVSPRVVNQFAAQVAQSYQTSLPPKYETPAQSVIAASQIPASSLPPDVVPLPGGSTVYKFPSITWGFYPGTQFHAFYQELLDSLTVTRGRHTFKFGGDILNQPRKTQAAAAPLGAWTFKDDIYFNPSDPAFNWSSLAAAIPVKFTATYPTIPYVNQNLESAVYAQDEWKLRPNLTLSLGLRYDLQTKVWNNHLTADLYPKPLPYVTFGGHGAYDNFAPRVGFAWDPANDGKTVLRGGYGIVYTMNSNNIYGGEVTTLRQASIVVSVPAGIASFPDPYNGQGYEKYVSTAPPNISINNNRVSNPPVNTGSMGATRQLTSDIALNIDAFYSKITQAQITSNVNAPYESAPGVNVLPLTRPLPAYGQINEVSSGGSYAYRAFTTRLDKRYARHYQYTVAYTLAKQWDNYGNSSGQTSLPARTDFYYPAEDRGLSAVDRRNVLVLSGSTRLPLGITAGGIYTLRSSLPLSATTGVDNNNDGAITDYVPGTVKALHNKGNLLTAVNAWRATQNLPAINLSQIQSNRYNQLDARVSKDFRISDRYTIQAVGQLFNVFGTDNFGGVGVSQITNTSGVKATFGQITSAFPRQQGELAVRFLF